MIIGNCINSIWSRYCGNIYTSIGVSGRLGSRDYWGLGTIGVSGQLGSRDNWGLGTIGASGLLGSRDFWGLGTFGVSGLLGSRDFWGLGTFGVSGLLGTIEVSDFWGLLGSRDYWAIGTIGPSGLLGSRDYWALGTIGTFPFYAHHLTLLGHIVKMSSKCSIYYRWSRISYIIIYYACAHCTKLFSTGCTRAYRRIRAIGFPPVV